MTAIAPIPYHYTSSGTEMVLSWLLVIVAVSTLFYLVLKERPKK